MDENLEDPEENQFTKEEPEVEEQYSKEDRK